MIEEATTQSLRSPICCEFRAGLGSSASMSHPARTVGVVADKSAIEWTEATWNPTTGCDRVSPGCDHCYALTLSKRLKAMGSPKYQLDGDPKTSGPGFRLTIHPSSLDVPQRWSSPRLIFVNSMSDLFHDDVPIEFIRQVLDVVRDTPQHTYQVLTKRALKRPGFRRGSVVCVYAGLAEMV